MQKYLAASLIVLGIILTAYGLDTFDSMGSRVSRLFAGWPADAPTWSLFGGVLAVMIGLSLAAYRRQRA
jgi:uncharacterized membrane protein YdcZ (DUF606 family)